MDLWSGNKSSGTAAALDDPFAFLARQGVPSRHEAHLVRLGQFALGCNGVPGIELRRFDALADGILNSLVNRCSVAVISGHNRFSSLSSLKLHDDWRSF